MSKNQLGLVLGSLLALLHVVWSLAVAVMPAALQNFLNWDLALHHIDFQFTLLPFNLGNAVILVILTFIVGYLVGWISGWLIKTVGKCCEK